MYFIFIIDIIKLLNIVNQNVHTEMYLSINLNIVLRKLRNSDKKFIFL